MANVPFNFAGQAGINLDVAPHELQPPIWSNGRNMKFRDGRATREKGSRQVFGTPSVVPYWVMFAFSATDAYWMYSNLTKMYATDGATHADITRAVGGDYSTTEERLWNGGMFSGIPVITNGVDKPQFWAPVSLSTDMADLTNWLTNDRCQVIKPFKNFLVAGNIIRSGTQFPHMVKWSDAAAPGALPGSWDHTDPTNLAGERDLGDNYAGGILDMLVLRDMLAIYKDNATWGMQFIGGTQIMRTWTILASSGILSGQCVGDIHEGRAHVLGMQDDFVMFDGQSATSVVDKKMRAFITNSLTSSQAIAKRSFVFVNERENEAWYCFATSGSDWPDTAVVWNFRENTLALRDLIDGTSSMSSGAVEDTSDVWDIDLATWDSDTTLWDELTFRASFFSPVASVPTANKIIEYDFSYQHDGVDYLSYLERTDIALIGKDRLTGEFKADLEVRKLCDRVWIKMKPGSSPIDVKVGTQDRVGGVVTWGPTQTFDPATMQYIDRSENGLLLAIRFERSTDGVVDLEGFDMEIKAISRM